MPMQLFCRCLAWRLDSHNVSLRRQIVGCARKWVWLAVDQVVNGSFFELHTHKMMRCNSKT